MGKSTRTKRHKLHLLTENEKVFAEENHNLIYSFIHRYSYSIEEHYYILVFGYLKAVQIYLLRPDLQQKYDFPFISWMYMRSEIGNHFRMEKSQSRKAIAGINNITISYLESDSLYNHVNGKSYEDDILENILMVECLHELLENLTESQSMIVQLKIYGYSNKEICLLMEMKTSTYYKEVKRIKGIMERLLLMG